MLLDILVIVFLLGIALALLLIEIFLLPGITVAGLGGLLFATGGIIYAYTEVSVLIGNISLVISLGLFGGAFIWLMRSKTLDKYALQTNIVGRITSNKELNIHVGDEGIAISRLNPMGKIKVNGVIAEGTSTGEFIPEGTTIHVIKVTAGAILVEIKKTA